MSASPVAVALAFVAITCAACHGRAHHERDDDDPQSDEGGGEDEDLTRTNFWRVEVRINGHGTVSGAIARLDCADDRAQQHGTCGPTLLRFDELHPPLLRATAAPGWRFDHWEPTVRERDGSMRGRRGRIPDGPLYLDGFGYSDTGELEILTAVFVAAPTTSAVPARQP